MNDILLNNNELSVGVITFYRDQRDLIKEALKQKGILESDESTRLVPKYNVKGIVNRFKIGTVDAFQGQEFDVVILSLVRSNKIKLDSNDKTLRNKYGFLSIPNRQNVAFSRAKKLLITVGDFDMFSKEELKNLLFGFYELTKKCGGSCGTIINI